MMGKKCLITGITGMVGSHLCDYLLEHTDWEIHGLIRWRSPLVNISQHLQNPRVKLHYGDLTDIVSMEPILCSIDLEYIFHLAAQSFPKTSFQAPNSTYDVNVQGTQNILELVRKHRPNAVVHVCSSSEVFGRVSKERLPISEDCPFHPASPYAISKCGTDLIGRYFAEAFGLNTQITRMFTHTGPRRGDVFAESTFAKQIALAEIGKIEPVIAVGNLDSLRTVADVRDAVRAYHLLLTINPIPGSYYNIGGETTLTVGDILNRLISMSSINGLEVRVDPERLRPIDADLQIPNTKKFQSHTGWAPQYSIDQTLNDLLEYWRQRVATDDSTWIVR
jgi:GDP-mannose 4,6-dehydratase